MKMVVASKNEGKIAEIKSILKELDVHIVSQLKAGIEVEVKEDGVTFAQNAIKKAEQIMAICNCTTLADDSGLEVDYLNGAPGVCSARYAGINATDEQRNQKLIHALKGVPLEERTARFVCVIAIVFPNGERQIVEGKCEGLIGFELKGENGFGYDPLFYVPDYNMTMAEMENHIKNNISHRGQALQKLKQILKEYVNKGYRN